MKVLKTLAALAFALSGTLVLAAEADPPGVVGRLNLIEGPVSFAPAQASEDWTAATLNRPVTTGDRLWTDTNGRAEMHVGSLAIRMAAQTSMDVLNLDDRSLQLRLAQGSVNVRVRRFSSDRQLEIATPSGAVVVKQPGTYRISVDPAGTETTVTVHGGGQADVFTGNSTFAVRDGQQAAISGSRQDLFAAPPPDEFDRWTAARDQREDRVASTRYVPDEMTGYEDLDQYGGWQTVADYGAVWVPSTVPAGWAPYRQGHWVWVSPWGWTWVDDAPWGFAPFHYGRWVWFRNHWAWAPGRRVARPVYSPAMVAFIGGSNFSVSIGIGRAPAVGWVPLGWREPFIPWYRASRAHVQNVNITQVTNVNTNVTNIRYANRRAPSGVTVVSRENFVAARPVRQASLNVSARTLAAAPVTRGSPVATPARASLTASQPGSRPPAAVTTREAVAVNAPPARDAARAGQADARGGERFSGNEERPRVRVINRQARVNLPVSDAQRAAAPAAQSAAEAPRVNAPAQSASDAQRSRPPVERGNARSPDGTVRQPHSGPRPEQARPVERPQERVAPPSQGAQAERRAPGPPPEVSRRPTFDREMRAATPAPATPPAAESRREQQQANRQERREQASLKGNAAPPAQAAPQPENRSVSGAAPDAQRAQQEQQRQVQEQQGREQQARQRDAQRQQEEQQRAQQQQARQDRERQQQAQQQQAQQQRAQQQERERQQQAQKQQAQQQQAQQQRAQQQERERQQQAQKQQAQQQQAQQQRAQQQQAQQQQAQQQAQRQQAQQQQAQQQQTQQQQAQQQRREQPRGTESHEKGGREERPRADKSEKG